MEFIKSWKFMALIVAVLAVVAIAGVIFGVATHEEPGLSNPEARWDHAPLTVRCTGYSEGFEGCDAVLSAMDTLNARLGFSMLSATTDDEADIVVVARAPVEIGHDTCGAPGECFELTGSANIYQHCDIRTMNVVGVGDLEWLVSYHGLGHCIGLAHDDFELSIMRPVQSATPDGSLPPWLSDHDRRLLRDLYAPIRR